MQWCIFIIMNTWFIAHRITAILFNAFFISWILYAVINADSDKSPGMFMILYMALTFLNLLIAVILSLFKIKHFKIYRQIFLGELLLFIPLILIVVNQWVLDRPDSYRVTASLSSFNVAIVIISTGAHKIVVLLNSC